MDVSSWHDMTVPCRVGSVVNHFILGLNATAPSPAAGATSYGQCGVTSWRDIIGITAGRYITASASKRTERSWRGRNDEGQCEVSDWKGRRLRRRRYDFTWGLTKDRRRFVRGRGRVRFLNVSGWKDIKAVCACYRMIIGIREDGNGRPERGTTRSGTSTSRTGGTSWPVYGERFLRGGRLRADGTVVAHHHIHTLWPCGCIGAQ
jgi:hypothetical protein